MGSEYIILKVMYSDPIIPSDHAFFMFSDPMIPLAEGFAAEFYKGPHIAWLNEKPAFGWQVLSGGVSFKPKLFKNAARGRIT